MKSFRVIEDGPSDSVRNMAVDWALLHLRGEDVIPDTLRFYSWRKRTVSVGYSQDICRELDLKLCRKFDTDVVFRATGGALVLHGYDLTYSLIVGIPDLNPSKWSDFSHRVGRALCGGLREIGLEPACVESGEVGGRRNRGACFSSPVGNEITVNGRKIIGNAKRWKEGALLQHGSISLRNAELSIVDLMADLDDGERESKRKKLETCSTTIEKESGRIMTCDELRTIMLRAFEEEFGHSFEPGSLGANEESRTNDFVGLVRRGPDRRRELRNARRHILAMGGNGR